MTNLSGTNLNRRGATSPKGEGRDSPSSFPRYPAYKDSGVEWLGEVPAHWVVSPLKRFVIANDGGVWGDEPSGEAGTPVLRSTEQTVDGHWKIENPALRQLSIKEAAAAKLSEGDLVVTKSSGSSAHIGKTTVVTREMAEVGFCYSNFMQRLRFLSSISPKVAWYLMNNEVVRLQLDNLSNSTTGLANLNGELIGNVVVPVAPVAEQKAIAAFLDHETAKIDALVAEQKRLIELLKEKRQAVISHAVTKGLDPNVPMKDSGVEWLGEVPAHWESKRIKHLVASVEQGWSPQCEGIPVDSAADWGVLKVGCVNGGNFDPKENKRLPSDLSPDKRLAISAGDLLVSRANTRDLVGSAAVALEDYPNLLLCDKLYRLRLKEMVDPELLGYYLGIGPVRAQIELSATGASSSMLNIGQATILDLVVPLAPVSEQQDIVRRVREKIAQLAALLAQCQAAVDQLGECRSALISAAVTGKIDVRGWRPPVTQQPAPHAEEVSA